MLINRRNGLMAGKRLPYDSEVEYLESTGTQHVNTGYHPTSAIGFDMRFNISNGAWAFMAGNNFNTNIIGVYGGTTGSAIYLRIRNSQLLFSPYIGVDTSATLSNGTMTVGSTSTSVSAFIYPYDFELSLFSQGSSRIYYAKFFDNGVLVRDYIPVRVGNVGEMYDRVSGKFAERHGTFIIGADKARGASAANGGGIS